MSTHVPEQYGDPHRAERILTSTKGGRQIPLSCIMGMREVAAYFSVTTRAVAYWMHRPGCPKPILELSAGKFYDIRDFIAWRPASADSEVFLNTSMKYKGSRSKNGDDHGK